MWPLHVCWLCDRLGEGPEGKGCGLPMIARPCDRLGEGPEGKGCGLPMIARPYDRLGEGPRSPPLVDITTPFKGGECKKQREGGIRESGPKEDTGEDGEERWGEGQGMEVEKGRKVKKELGKEGRGKYRK